LQTAPTPHNKHYIATKRSKLGHMLDDEAAS
jgi:GTP cyclohydrolase II